MTSNNFKGMAEAMQSKTEIFIQKAKGVHGEKYDYSQTVYVRNVENVKIICPVHGVFEQSPKSHLKGCHCLQCSGKARSNTEDYIQKVKQIHGDKYDYSLVKYESRSKKVRIICKKHGEFMQVAKEHFKYGCYECGIDTIKNKLSSDTEKFIGNAREIHGEKYNYDHVEYKRNKIRVKIKCPDHGEFLQRPNDHLSGSGCPACKNEITLWRRSKYIELCKERHDDLSNLYLIKCRGENEEFFKIGITARNVKKRFSYDMPYDFEIIELVTEKAAFIWDLEKSLHRLLSKFRYQPKNTFGGHNECFSNIPREALKMIAEIKNSNQIPLIA